MKLQVNRGYLIGVMERAIDNIKIKGAPTVDEIVLAALHAGLKGEPNVHQGSVTSKTIIIGDQRCIAIVVTPPSCFRPESQQEEGELPC